MKVSCLGTGALALAFAPSLAGCAREAREAFSPAGLIADAPAYVAARYGASEPPRELIADLEAAGFSCVRHATASACEQSRPSEGDCADVAVVRIFANAPVEASEVRRCDGAEASSSEHP